METLALHFRFNFYALYFPVIAFVLTYSPECRLCIIIINTTGEKEEGVESISFSSSKTQQNHPKAALHRGQRGNRSIPTVGPSFFSVPAGSARSPAGRQKRPGNCAAPRGAAEAAGVLTPLIISIQPIVLFAPAPAASQPRGSTARPTLSPSQRHRAACSPGAWG